MSGVMTNVWDEEDDDNDDVLFVFKLIRSVHSAIAQVQFAINHGSVPQIIKRKEVIMSEDSSSEI